MIRTFIAIDIADEKIISKIVGIQKQLVKSGSSMKLVEPENLHITLYFLGEIPESSLRYVEEAVTNCTKGVEPFTIDIGGVGAFPTIKRPRVLWIAVTKNSDKIEFIANCLKKILPSRGFRREPKSFHAHITLARVKRYNSSLRDMLTKLSDVYIGSIPVSNIKIKKSTLTPKGPIYKDIKVIELGST